MANASGMQELLGGWEKHDGWMYVCMYVRPPGNGAEGWWYAQVGVND